MKLASQWQKMRSNRGAALPTAAVAAAILSIVVAGVLSYMGNEYTLNFRSHRWTQALHLAEAGVEIGFAEYHYQYFLGKNGFTSARGWVNQGGGTYTKTVSNLVDNVGAVVGTVGATVTGVGSGAPKILGVGYCATTPRGPIIARAVRVTLAPSATFPTAMAARQGIEMNGNNIYVDSFDSGDPLKSGSGGVYDYSKRQPNGNVATNSELSDSLAVGNADIYGLVATGPNGTVSLGSSGSLGPTLVTADRATDLAQAEANGWVRHDFQVDIPKVDVPSGLTSAYNLGSVTSSYAIYGGNWRMSSVELAGSDYISINGNVSIYVTGDMRLTGNSYIRINPGSSLRIYAAGAVAIAGNAVINDTARAINNQFYGLNSSSSWSLNGNGTWVGTVYAPNANLAMNGGGARGDMSGSIIAKTITLNGQVQFHYDESLTANNNPTGYLVASWQSLKLVGGSWIAE